MKTTFTMKDHVLSNIITLKLAFNDYTNTYAITEKEGATIENGVLDFDKKLKKADAVEPLVDKAAFIAKVFKTLNKLPSLQLNLITDGFWQPSIMRELITNAERAHNITIRNIKGDVSEALAVTLNHGFTQHTGNLSLINVEEA